MKYVYTIFIEGRDEKDLCIPAYAASYYFLSRRILSPSEAAAVLPKLDKLLGYADEDEDPVFLKLYKALLSEMVTRDYGPFEDNTKAFLDYIDDDEEKLQKGSQACWDTHICLEDIGLGDMGDVKGIAVWMNRTLLPWVEQLDDILKEEDDDSS